MYVSQHSQISTFSWLERDTRLAPRVPYNHHAIPAYCSALYIPTMCMHVHTHASLYTDYSMR
jgi:hypothetical protein